MGTAFANIREEKEERERENFKTAGSQDKRIVKEGKEKSIQWCGEKQMVSEFKGKRVILQKGSRNRGTKWDYINGNELSINVVISSNEDNSEKV